MDNAQSIKCDAAPDKITLQVMKLLFLFCFYFVKISAQSIFTCTNEFIFNNTWSISIGSTNISVYSRKKMLSHFQDNSAGRDLIGKALKMEKLAYRAAILGPILAAPLFYIGMNHYHTVPNASLRPDIFNLFSIAYLCISTPAMPISFRAEMLFDEGYDYYNLSVMEKQGILNEAYRRSRIIPGRSFFLVRKGDGSFNSYSRLLDTGNFQYWPKFQSLRYADLTLRTAAILSLGLSGYFFIVDKQELSLASLVLAYVPALLSLKLQKKLRIVRRDLILEYNNRLLQ